MIRIHNPHPLPFLHQTEMFLRAGTLCDTVLMVEGHIFKAHALILSWASKNLARQLTNQNPGKGYSCTVYGVPPHTVKQILDYMYSAWVEVPKGDLPDLLRGARHLEVQSLLEQCQLHMDVQDGVKGGGERFSPDIDVRHCDSIKKFPSSDETSLSSSLESHQVTHFSQKSQQATTPSPPPQKPPLTLAVAPPVAPREPLSTTAPCSPLSQNPSVCWPPLNPSRQMLLSYSDLMAVQHMLAYSYPTPMYPFLQHTFQLQLPPSLLGYSGLLHTHQRLIRPRPLTLDNPLAPDLSGKAETVSAALPNAGSHERERKQKEASEQETVCRHCRKPAGETWRQNSRSANPGSDEMIHECKFCSRTRVKRSLRSLRRSLGEEKPYQCKNCSKRFSLKHQLDTHLRVHTGEKPFECRLCGQRSRDYSAMIKHLRTHGGATPYQCTMCLEFCSSLATMQKHLKGHPSQDFPPNWNLSSTYLYTCHT